MNDSFLFYEVKEAEKALPLLHLLSKEQTQ